MTSPDKAPVIPETRLDYMTGAGFVLGTDVSNEVMRDATHAIPGKLTRYAGRHFDPESIAKNPSGLVLYEVAKSHKDTVHDTVMADNFYDTYNLSTADQERAKSHFTTRVSGFGDLDFTSYFAPTVANAAVLALERDGFISSQERADLTLTDWANVINTGWFSKLTHSLAITRNGFYRSLGISGSTYAPNYFENHIRSQLRLPIGTPVFETSAKPEPEDGFTYATASLAQIATMGLRNQLPTEGSGLYHNSEIKGTKRLSQGCPVARFAASLPPEMAETDDHLRQLLENGTMQVVPGRSNEEVLTVTQEYSAIDYALLATAKGLEAYDRMYGTPRFTERKGKIYTTHEHRESLDVLRRPTSTVS